MVDSDYMLKCRHFGWYWVKYNLISGTLVDTPALHIGLNPKDFQHLKLWTKYSPGSPQQPPQPVSQLHSISSLSPWDLSKTQTWLLFVFNSFLNVYFWKRERERERDSTQGMGRERGRHTIWSRLQGLSCEHKAWCLMRGSNSRTVRSWPELRSDT